MSELRSAFYSADDGVMTNEAGVLSGLLELRTRLASDGSLTLTVRYLDGGERWHTVHGENYRLHDPRDHRVLHHLLVNALDRPLPVCEWDAVDVETPRRAA